MKISASFLSGKDSLKTRISKLDKTTVDYIHVDFMDGVFVPEKPFTMSDVVKPLRQAVHALDVHLMVKNPMKYIKDFALLNTEYITIQIEAVKDPLEVIYEINNYGIKGGIAINPETPVSKIEKYLSDVELILVMSVNPGQGGQGLIEECLTKIEQLKAIRDTKGFSFIIEVDGGIKDYHIETLNEKGADMCVVGSFICNEDNYQAQVDKLR